MASNISFSSTRTSSTTPTTRFTARSCPHTNYGTWFQRNCAASARTCKEIPDFWSRSYGRRIEQGGRTTTNTRTATHYATNRPGVLDIEIGLEAGGSTSDRAGTFAGEKLDSFIAGWEDQFKYQALTEPSRADRGYIK